MQYLADGSLEHERNSCASGSSVDTPGKRKSLIQRRLLLPIPIGSVHAKRSENLCLTRTYVDMRTQLELMPHGNLCLKGTYQSPTTLQNRNLLLPAAPAVAVNDGVSRRLRDVTPSQGSQLLRLTYLRGTPSTLAWSSKESLQAQQQAPQSDIIIQMYVVDVKISSVALLHRASLILLKGCAQTSYYF